LAPRLSADLIDGIYQDDGSFRSAADLRRVFSVADLDGTGACIT
jgi:hypothetical protein